MPEEENKGWVKRFTHTHICISHLSRLCAGAAVPGTHARAHIVQVGGIHSCAQRHGSSLSLLQIVLHLHDVELKVHKPALLDPTLLIHSLQLLLQVGQDSLICRENETRCRTQYFSQGRGVTPQSQGLHAPPSCRPQVCIEHGKVGMGLSVCSKQPSSWDLSYSVLTGWRDPEGELCSHRQT